MDKETDDDDDEEEEDIIREREAIVFRDFREHNNNNC